MAQSRSQSGFHSLPVSACWRHGNTQVGFETSFFRPDGAGWMLSGSTSGIEAGVAWVVDYELAVDEAWHTTLAVVHNRTADGTRSLRLESAGNGEWLVDGKPSPALAGCLDVDLESSAMTNMLPVHRLALQSGARADAPAVYVRAADLAVERLEQVYTRIDDEDDLQRFDYVSVVDDFRCVLSYDASGLVLDYPGIAVRFA